MRILVADDEAPARARLMALLDEAGSDSEVVAEAANGAEVLQQCKRHEIDVVLLDIRMPGMDGIAAALALAQTAHPPAVIFVTAYDEHALAAFEANAIDYLLKPVRRDRLLRALRKARALNSEQRDALTATEAYIGVSYRGGVARIPVTEVIFLRADSKYVEVWHSGGMALAEESLRAIEERLPAQFLRVHRNALVSPGKIRELCRMAAGGQALAFDGCAEQVEVSRRHAAEVRRLLRGTE